MMKLDLLFADSGSFLNTPSPFGLNGTQTVSNLLKYYCFCVSKYTSDIFF